MKCGLLLICTGLSGWFVLPGCSGDAPPASTGSPSEPGGTDGASLTDSSAGGSTSDGTSSGGATAGANTTVGASSAGDANVNTVGVGGTGTTSATDGASESTTSSGTGGVGTTTDGTSVATSSGGASTTTDATSGATTNGMSGGGSSGTVTTTLDDYISRKWARWPMPNPPSLGLSNPMSYTETADGIVDDVTGLVWQQGTNGSTTNWADALSYCESLGDGWSLPTRIELTTILNNAVSGFKLDSGVFGGSSGWTWAATPWVVNERKSLTGDAALSWFINFSVGDSNNSLSQTATSAYSRCVKVPASRALPEEHYAVSAETVTDNYTRLTWQRAHSGDNPSLGFDQAGSYCEGLELDGGGWRLPSLNELASLVDDVPSGDVSPAIDHDVFPATSPDALYWSESPYGTNSDEHWTLNFEDGFTAHDANGTSGIARCVRD